MIVTDFTKKCTYFLDKNNFKSDHEYYEYILMHKFKESFHSDDDKVSNKIKQKLRQKIQK